MSHARALVGTTKRASLRHERAMPVLHLSRSVCSVESVFAASGMDSRCAYSRCNTQTWTAFGLEVRAWATLWVMTLHGGLGHGRR